LLSGLNLTASQTFPKYLRKFKKHITEPEVGVCKAHRPALDSLNQPNFAPKPGTVI